MLEGRRSSPCPCAAHAASRGQSKPHLTNGGRLATRWLFGRAPVDLLTGAVSNGVARSRDSVQSPSVPRSPQSHAGAHHPIGVCEMNFTIRKYATDARRVSVGRLAGELSERSNGRA